MFEHKDLDGEKHRVLPPVEAFIKQEVLETREPKLGNPISGVGRQQYGVTGEVLVERFLPPETVGEAWSYDPGTPWWLVVGNPPHAGIVADFNRDKGGTYRRKLSPDHNVVAYADEGEEVLLQVGEYVLTRKSDNQELRQQTLALLRDAYRTG